jgi:hypothetical protein
VAAIVAGIAIASSRQVDDQRRQPTDLGQVLDDRGVFHRVGRGQVERQRVDEHAEAEEGHR